MYTSFCFPVAAILARLLLCRVGLPSVDERLPGVSLFNDFLVAFGSPRLVRLAESKLFQD